MLVSPAEDRDAGYGLPTSEYHALYALRDEAQPLPASQFWVGRYEGSHGRDADVVGELSALAKAHPHSEPVAALRMRALYASGRQAEAFDVYDQIRRWLVKELAVEPGRGLRRVHQAILRGEPA